MRQLIRKRAGGFTLMEAIVVMVLTAILAGVMVLFIRNPVQSYVDSAGRAEMTDVAEITLRRMAREIHGAVPNSIRFTTSGGDSYLEFIPSKAGGRYLTAEDGADTTQQPHPALSFTDDAALTFEVIGPMPLAQYAIVQNDYIIINNLGTGFTDGDAYADNASNRALVDQVSGKVITLKTNPFAKHVTPPSSKRFIVAAQPVTFGCVRDATTGMMVLRRYSGYGFLKDQPAPPTAGQAALMADHVLGCNFSVMATANRQTALVGLAIALARSKPGAANNLETVTLAQQIHVDNTP